MNLHNGGKYNGDENTLPKREHHPKAIKFKEFESMKKLSIISNVGCILTIIILAIPFIFLAKEYIKDNTIWLALGGICGGLSLPIHELLHAFCYKKDVYYYNNLNQGLVFVAGTEDMCKFRFISMCLCPNIVLGVIPYIVFLLFPNIVFLGLFGLINIGTGFGDYINIYNAIRQMPKGAKTYLSGGHSYWFLDNK